MRTESYWKAMPAYILSPGLFRRLVVSLSLSARARTRRRDDAFYWIHLECVCSSLDLLVFLQAIELTEQTFFAAERNGGGTYYNEFDLHLF